MLAKPKQKSAPVPVRIFAEVAKFTALLSAQTKMSARAKSLSNAASRPPREQILAIDKFMAEHKNALPPKTVRRLENYRSDLWDLQIEEDAESGALERAFGKMAAKAIREDEQGKTTPL